MDYSKLFLSWFLSISSLAFLGFSADQSASLTCMQKLLPCQPYLHSSSPPASCCIPLKAMVEDDGDCLCQIFNNPALLKSFNLTQDDALKLPKACGFNPDISVCKNATTPSPGSPVSPSPSTPSNNSSGGSTAKNSADGISYFGGYGFVGLLIVALFVSPF